MSLKMARKNNNVSLKELSINLGISGCKLLFMERFPSLIPSQLALRWSRYLGVSLDDIFFD